MSKKAIIDLGTNTFNLLIAEVKDNGFEVLHSEKEGVALGMGGINKKMIAPEAFERGIAALKKFKATCVEKGAEEIRAIGTSALRDATNSDDFASEVRQQTGIEVEIISGDQEAAYIYAGVSWSYHFEHPGIIMDIGGGSTEFILADHRGVQWQESYDIGVSRIYQEFELSDPCTTEDVKRLESWLEAQTSGQFEHLHCDVLVGASGSFETFYEMIHHREFEANFETIEIPMDELLHILEWLIYSTQAQRDEHPYIIPIRRKMGALAALKTRWVLQKIGAKQCFVTPCSLKEGVLRTISDGD